MLLSHFSHVQLCDPIDGSPPGSPVPGILQARILERAAGSFSNACMHAKSLQSCPTLCDPTDGSPLGSPVHGIPRARTLEWAAFPFSRGICPTQGSDPRLLCLLHRRQTLSHVNHQGSLEGGEMTSFECFDPRCLKPDVSGSSFAKAGSG